MQVSGMGKVTQRLKFYHHMARLFSLDAFTGTGRA